MLLWQGYVPLGTRRTLYGNDGTIYHYFPIHCSIYFSDLEHVRVHASHCRVVRGIVGIYPIEASQLRNEALLELDDLNDLDTLIIRTLDLVSQVFEFFWVIGELHQILVATHWVLGKSFTDWRVGF